MPESPWENSTVESSSRQPDSTAHRVLWIVLLTLFCAYAGIFIYRTSFVADGVRYFSLFDDAMVGMKYARNLASGEGLRWNPGDQPVEGFTTPLWVLYMGLLHLLPVSAAKISLLVQISCAALLLLNLQVVRRLAERVSNNQFGVSFVAVLLVAFYYPLNDWSLQGMEVGLLALVVSSTALFAISAGRSNRSIHLLYLALAAASLIRLDAVLICVAICLTLAWTEAEHRRRHLVLGFAYLAAFLGIQTIIRWSYYGELLPNTYYLKVVGYPVLDRIARGFKVTAWFVYRMNPLLVVVPFIVVWRQKRADLYLLGSILLMQVLYSIYVGGDAWETTAGANRYVAIAMPLFFVLFAYSVFALASHLKHRWRPILLAILVPVALVWFNWRAGLPSIREFLLLSPPLHVRENQQSVNIALLLKYITLPEARIAIIAAGAVPYFSERNCVDMLGKNDKQIARLPMRRLPIGFYPGHLKWDYAYSIGQLRPDIVAERWKDPEEFARSIGGHYLSFGNQEFTVLLKKDSERLDWPRIEGLAGRSLEADRKSR